MAEERNPEAEVDIRVNLDTSQAEQKGRRLNETIAGGGWHASGCARELSRRHVAIGLQINFADPGDQVSLPRLVSHLNHHSPTPLGDRAERIGMIVDYPAGGGYLMPIPVLNSTTRSPAPSHPDRARWRIAATQAPPSGAV